jgi:hypothetical protein
LSLPRSMFCSAFVGLFFRLKQSHFITKVFEVTPSLYMVELRKSNGDTIEFHKVNCTILFIAYTAIHNTVVSSEIDSSSSWDQTDFHIY